MAPEYENSIKRAKLQHQSASSSSSGHLLLILFLLLSLYLSQRSLPVSSQDNFETNGKTSFASSSSSLAGPSKVGPSKTSSNHLKSRFNFREHIVHLRRKQQQQVIEQKQHQVVEQQHQQQQQQQVVEQSIDQQEQQQLVGSSGLVEQSLSSTPGVDFPAYSSIPNTKFSCASVPYDPGMYADESTGCQVYHMCYQGRRESFLCGEGTAFNQAIMNCDFWHSVDCSNTSSHYHLNADFGRSSSEPAAASGAGGSYSFVQQRVLQEAQLPAILTKSPVQREIQLEDQSYLGATKGGGEVANIVKPRLVNNLFQSRPLSSTSSLRDYQQFTSQRKLVRAQIPLSPSRRVSQLSSFDRGASQHQFSSAESSPLGSISATFKMGGSLQVQPVEQVGSSLIVAGELNETPTKSTSRVESQASTKRQIQSVKVDMKHGGSKTGILETNGVKVVNSAREETNDDVWKPYFKSKTKSPQGRANKSSGEVGANSKEGRATQSKNPILTGPNSTTRASGAKARPSESTIVTERPLTLSQPDREPNFGGIGDASSTTAFSKELMETSRVPKSEPPPAVQSTIGPLAGQPEQTTTPSPAVAIESDVSETLNSTAPAGDSGGSRSTEATTTSTEQQASSTTTESPPQSTTISSDVAENAATRAASEPSSPLTTTTTTTTTTTIASSEITPITTTSTTAPLTTSIKPAAPTESSTLAGEGGEKEGSSSSEVEMKKKRRGTLTAGVEYANESNSKRRKKTSKSAVRANSSFVEYATG